MIGSAAEHRSKGEEGQTVGQANLEMGRGTTWKPADLAREADVVGGVSRRFKWPRQLVQQFA